MNNENIECVENKNVRTTFEISEDLLFKFKEKLLINRVTMKAVLNDFISEYIGEPIQSNEQSSVELIDRKVKVKIKKRKK